MATVRPGAGNEQGRQANRRNAEIGPTGVFTRLGEDKARVGNPTPPRVTPRPSPPQPELSQWGSDFQQRLANKPQVPGYLNKMGVDSRMFSMFDNLAQGNSWNANQDMLGGPITWKSGAVGTGQTHSPDKLWAAVQGDPNLMNGFKAYMDRSGGGYGNWTPPGGAPPAAPQQGAPSTNQLAYTQGPAQGGSADRMYRGPMPRHFGPAMGGRAFDSMPAGGNSQYMAQAGGPQMQTMQARMDPSMGAANPYNGPQGETSINMAANDPRRDWGDHGSSQQLREAQLAYSGDQAHRGWMQRQMAGTDPRSRRGRAPIMDPATAARNQQYSLQDIYTDQVEPWRLGGPSTGLPTQATQYQVPQGAAQRFQQLYGGPASQTGMGPPPTNPQGALDYWSQRGQGGAPQGQMGGGIDPGNRPFAGNQQLQAMLGSSNGTWNPQMMQRFQQAGQLPQFADRFNPYGGGMQGMSTNPYLDAMNRLSQGVSGGMAGGFRSYSSPDPNDPRMAHQQAMDQWQQANPQLVQQAQQNLANFQATRPGTYDIKPQDSLHYWMGQLGMPQAPAGPPRPLGATIDMAQGGAY